MTKNKEYKFKLITFRAIDEPALCKEYLLGHQKVLSDHGIENVTTNNDVWMNNSHVYCVVARDLFTQEMVGGVRIQIADGTQPLPVEVAIGEMDPDVHKKVDYYARNGGIGESCGLWISKMVKGVGMSRYLMWASIASASQLNFRTMLGICAGYTLKLFGEIGFVIDRELGDKGDFPYPNEKYIAHVIGILNAITIETANEVDKEVMLSFRKSPNQKRVEKNKNIISTIKYNLHYDNISELSYKKSNNSLRYS
jgi:hypothetical protein